MKTSLLFAFLTSLILFISCKSSSEPEIPEGKFEWTSLSGSAAGMNDSLLNSGYRAADDLNFVNGILIARDGKICAEKYFNNYSSSSYQTVRSVSKSFLSAIIGIAVNKGLLSLDRKFVDLFPEYNNVSDYRFKNITLRHLLTMQSGIRGDEEFYMTFYMSSNWINTIANRELLFSPGSSFFYSTAGTHLISAMLTKATGMSTRAFAERHLLEPMGITVKNWARDPQGFYFGGNDMYFTLRDIALLGVLYLNNGRLGGEQIVPADWVNSSIVYNNPNSSYWGSISSIGYGYLWWSGNIKGHRGFFAIGHGGQYVFCVPEHNAVIAIFANPNGDWDTADIQERQINGIIADYLLPAIN